MPGVGSLCVFAYFLSNTFKLHSGYSHKPESSIHDENILNAIRKPPSTRVESRKGQYQGDLASYLHLTGKTTYHISG
ncbi:hypothetical protein CEXT_316921, partial [Caerostris extrusa]